MRRLSWKLGSEIEANFVAGLQHGAFQCLVGFPELGGIIQRQNAAAKRLGASQVVFDEGKQPLDVEIIGVDGVDTGGGEVCGLMAEVVADGSDAGKVTFGVLKSMKAVALAERKLVERGVFAEVPDRGLFDEAEAIRGDFFIS